MSSLAVSASYPPISINAESASSSLPCLFNHTVHDDGGSPGDTSASFIYSFNLCPLFERITADAPLRVMIHEDTPPTSTDKVYEMAINPQGKGLKRDGTLTDELQCPKGTWVCLTVSNSRPSHPSEPTRVLQVVPIAGNLRMDPKHSELDVTSRLDLDVHPSSELDDHREHDTPRYHLSITLHGGYYTNLRQKVVFKYTCDTSSPATSDDDHPSVPDLDWSFNGTHAFKWKTTYACATISPAPGRNDEESKEPLDNDDPQKPPPDEEEEHRDEEQDDHALNPPSSTPEHLFRSRPGQVILAAIPIGLCLYLLLPPLFRRLHLRPGASNLTHLKADSAMHSIVGTIRSFYTNLSSRQGGYTTIPNDHLDSEMTMLNTDDSPRRKSGYIQQESRPIALLGKKSSRPRASSSGSRGAEREGEMEAALWSDEIPLTPSPGHSVGRSYGVVDVHGAVGRGSGSSGYGAMNYTNRARS